MPVSLTVATEGHGTVSNDVAGIACGSDCAASFAPGTTLILTATPDSGWYLETWDGCSVSYSRTCGVELDGDTTIRAAFAPTGDLLGAMSEMGSGLKRAGELLSAVGVTGRPLPPGPAVHFPPPPDTESVRQAGEVLLSLANTIDSLAHTPPSQHTRDTIVSLSDSFTAISGNVLDLQVLSTEFHGVSLDMEELAIGLQGLRAAVERLGDPALVEPFDVAARSLHQAVMSISNAADAPSPLDPLGPLAAVAQAFSDIGAATEGAGGALVELGWWPWSDDCSCGDTAEISEPPEGAPDLEELKEKGVIIPSDPIYKCMNFPGEFCDTCEWWIAPKPELKFGFVSILTGDILDIKPDPEWARKRQRELWRRLGEMTPEEFEEWQREQRQKQQGL